MKKGYYLWENFFFFFFYYSLFCLLGFLCCFVANLSSLLPYSGRIKFDFYKRIFPDLFALAFDKETAIALYLCRLEERVVGILLLYEISWIGSWNLFSLYIYIKLWVYVYKSFVLLTSWCVGGFHNLVSSMLVLTIKHWEENGILGFLRRQGFCER